MSNYIPIFEVKDSFIIKHKLNYDTTYENGEYDSDGNFISYRQRMIFTDYELARKSQTKYIENFHPIIIQNRLNDLDEESNYYLVDTIIIEYLDYKYKLSIDDKIVEYENIWKENGINNVQNVYKPTKTQIFTTIENIEDINIGDIITVEIYRKETEYITLNWNINSVYVGETFFFSGVSTSGKQWVKKIVSTKIGYSFGTEIVEVYNIIPKLKYDSIVLDINNNIIKLENKIEMYLFNNFSTYDDLYFKIISNNHCIRSYSSILDKLRYFKYYDYFDFKLYTGDNSIDSYDDYLEITPKINNDNIYFYYDKLVIKLGSLTGYIPELDYVGSDYVEPGYCQDGLYPLDEFNESLYVDPINYAEDGYHNLYNYYRYNFITRNIYSKYTLAALLEQYEFVSKETDYYIYNTEFNNSVTLSDEDSNYLYFEFGNNGMFSSYSYVKLTTNVKDYYVLIVNKYVDNITDECILNILKPNNYENELLIGDIVTISNIGKLREISYILDRTFLNYNYLEFRKISADLQRKIYHFYADIINKLEMNEEIRSNFTGIIFQNQKNKMVLKIFNPNDTNDNRLLYTPIELTHIGKDKKTTLPINIGSDVLNKITNPL